MELSDPKIKNFLIFFQKKLSLYFTKQNFPASSLTKFRKEFSKPKKLKKNTEKISNISGNVTFLLHSPLIFREMELSSRKINIFLEMELYSSRLKKLSYFFEKMFFLYFRKNFQSSKKQNFLYFSKKSYN